MVLAEIPSNQYQLAGTFFHQTNVYILFEFWSHPPNVFFEKTFHRINNCFFNELFVHLSSIKIFELSKEKLGSEYVNILPSVKIFAFIVLTFGQIKTLPGIDHPLSLEKSMVFLVELVVISMIDNLSLLFAGKILDEIFIWQLRK